MNTHALKQTKASKLKHWYDGYEVPILIGGLMLLWAADHIVTHIILPLFSSHA